MFGEQQARPQWGGAANTREPARMPRAAPHRTSECARPNTATAHHYFNGSPSRLQTTSLLLGWVLDKGADSSGGARWTREARDCERTGVSPVFGRARGAWRVARIATSHATHDAKKLTYTCTHSLVVRTANGLEDVCDVQCLVSSRHLALHPRYPGARSLVEEERVDVLDKVGRRRAI